MPSFRDDTQSQNSPNKLATPDRDSQLGSNFPNSKAPENSSWMTRWTPFSVYGVVRNTPCRTHFFHRLHFFTHRPHFFVCSICGIVCNFCRDSISQKKQGGGFMTIPHTLHSAPVSFSGIRSGLRFTLCALLSRVDFFKDWGRDHRGCRDDNAQKTQGGGVMTTPHNVHSVHLSP